MKRKPPVARAAAGERDEARKTGDPPQPALAGVPGSRSLDQRHAGPTLPTSVVLGLLGAVGNASLARILSPRPPGAGGTLARANIALPSGGHVGDQAGPTVNRPLDIRPLADRLHVIWALTNDEYTALMTALTGVDPTQPVPLDRLGPLQTGLRRGREGSLAPAVATQLLGVEVSGGVGVAQPNAQPDLDKVAAALSAEGIATNADADAVTRGIAEMKTRVVAGTRPVRPVAISGRPQDFVAALFKQPGPGQPGLLAGGGFRMWPVLLRRPVRDQLTPQQIDEIVAKVRESRARVTVRDDVTVTRPPGAMYHKGLYYTRSKDALRRGAEPDPTNFESEEIRRGNTTPGVPGSEQGHAPHADPDRVRISRLAWTELLTEGSAASLNAYDSQLLTVGRGFGAKGSQGRLVLKEAIEHDAEAGERLLDVGFTVRGGIPLALNLQEKTVAEGDAALHLVEQDRIFGSQFASTFEDPAHIQAMVNAQLVAMRENAANIPNAVFDRVKRWPDASIRFAIHSRHFAGGLTWEGNFAPTNGDLLQLAKVVLRYCPHLTTSRGALLYLQEDTRALEWADDALRGRLTPCAEPEREAAAAIAADSGAQQAAAGARAAVAETRRRRGEGRATDADVGAAESRSRTADATAATTAATHARLEAQLAPEWRYFSSRGSFAKVQLP
jgi:hypothetical protein